MVVTQSISDFAQLFAGRTDVWGALHGEAVKETVKLHHYRRHLDGLTSLGVYPLRQDGTIRWCAVDIDNHDPKLPSAVMQCLNEIGLNRGVFCERSKGKGYHVIVFLSDWFVAARLRRIIVHVIKMAGLPSVTEVFPKQDALSRETPWGNYLNLPYFGGDNAEGKRMILYPHYLTPVPLVEWIQTVPTFPIDSIPLVEANLPPVQEHEAGKGTRGPSVASLISKPQATGNRRPVLVRMAGYLRHRGVSEEVAVGLLLPWARYQFDPVLEDGEVERHIRGIYRRYGSPDSTLAPSPADVVDYDAAMDSLGGLWQ